MSDFSHLPTHAKFIALMPQWDFLNFLASEAAHFPNFTLRMGWEATGLIQTTDALTTGVRANTPDGPVEIPATLTVGCDGRHAISRVAAHLPLIDEGVPVDILWLRIARQPSDPENALGYFNFGRFVILINRNDYFQVGYLIPKGAFPQIQQDGLPAFQQSIERIVPFLAGRTAEIDSWDKVKLLTIQVNHLQEWCSPGLLCIGDAAHAMSPVGGIGINIALQDAVATANLLTESLLSGARHRTRSATASSTTAKAPSANTQRFQIFAHRILSRALQAPAPSPRRSHFRSSPASPASSTSPALHRHGPAAATHQENLAAYSNPDSSSRITRVSRSHPSTLTLPVPSASKAPPRRRQPNPPRRQNPQNMRMRKQRHLPPLGAAAKACAITPSARSPTCSTVSPPTISFFQTDHPGICA